MTPAVFIFCSFVFSEKTVKNFDTLPKEETSVPEKKFLTDDVIHKSLLLFTAVLQRRRNCLVCTIHLRICKKVIQGFVNLHDLFL